MPHYLSGFHSDEAPLRTWPLPPQPNKGTYILAQGFSHSAQSPLPGLAHIYSIAPLPPPPSYPPFSIPAEVPFCIGSLMSMGLLLLSSCPLASWWRPRLRGGTHECMKKSAWYSSDFTTSRVHLEPSLQGSKHRRLKCYSPPPEAFQSSGTPFREGGMARRPLPGGLPALPSFSPGPVPGRGVGPLCKREVGMSMHVCVLKTRPSPRGPQQG